MTRYEFSWAVRPPSSRRWQGKQTINGFEVEITAVRIDFRSSLSDTSEGDLLKIVEDIAANLVRAMSFFERKRLTAVFIGVTPSDSVFEPRKNYATESDRARLAEAAPAEEPGADGDRVDQAKEVELSAIFDLAQHARRSPTLRQMLDRLGEFHGDPSRQLDPLYDILQVVEVKFRGRKRAAHALQITFAQLSKAAGFMNDPAIRTSRYPGDRAEGQRDATEGELNRCIDLAETIIRRYAALVRL